MRGLLLPGMLRKEKPQSKQKGKTCDKNTLVSVDGPMVDDHIDLTRGADRMQMDGDQIIGDSSILDVRFSLAHVRRDVEVLTLRDSVVKACKRIVTDLEVVEDEKSKEAHHLKKKISSLKKSCEASEARVNEREKEIDNLQSTLARA
ncbi:Uncharacterized protein Fot_18222 [Forsythia ovata]|uniref:Uncharacterized protein n=1 Tax=Forsythia ovata TaxID=205694 RepID=A0ABD1VHK8_9LAMI